MAMKGKVLYTVVLTCSSGAKTVTYDVSAYSLADAKLKALRRAIRDGRADAMPVSAARR